MLRWKIYAVFVALLGVKSISDHVVGNEPWSAPDFIGFPIAIWSAVGLVVYAFSIKLFTPRLWNAAQLIFLGWTAFSVRLVLGGSSEIGFKIAGAAIIAILMLFNWLALYRLAGSPWSGRIKRPA